MDFLMDTNPLKASWGPLDKFDTDFGRVLIYMSMASWRLVIWFCDVHDPKGPR